MCRACCVLQVMTRWRADWDTEQAAIRSRQVALMEELKALGKCQQVWHYNNGLGLTVAAKP